VSAINDGGPAFPIPIAGCNDGGVYNVLEQSGGQYGGMSLRDWFAGQASESDIMHWRNAVGIGCTREMAKYAHADAMLAARKGGSND